MPQFTILEHDHPWLHWDLLLDNGEPRIPTWRLAEPVCSVEAATEVSLVRIAAEPLANHRREYLDYEGPVSGDRGHVTQWDTGLYIPLTQRPDYWEVRLEGRRVSGFAVLTCTTGEEQPGLMLFTPDRQETEWNISPTEHDQDHDGAP